MAYCDYIIHCIRTLLLRTSQEEPQSLIHSLGDIQWDLHPSEGYLLSTRKALTVWDSNGKAYVVSVEEAPALDQEVSDDSIHSVV